MARMIKSNKRKNRTMRRKVMRKNTMRRKSMRRKTMRRKSMHRKSNRRAVRRNRKSKMRGGLFGIGGPSPAKLNEMILTTEAELEEAQDKLVDDQSTWTHTHGAPPVWQGMVEDRQGEILRIKEKLDGQIADLTGKALRQRNEILHLREINATSGRYL